MMRLLISFILISSLSPLHGRAQGCYNLFEGDTIEGDFGVLYMPSTRIVSVENSRFSVIEKFGEPIKDEKQDYEIVKFNENGFPIEFFEATTTSSEIGNFRSSNNFIIMVPTIPVAPTTANFI